MDSIKQLFRTRKRNQNVSLITRGIKIYAIQWSDERGHAHSLELPIDEVRILQGLLQVADIYDKYGVCPGNIDLPIPSGIKIEDGPSL